MSRARVLNSITKKVMARARALISIMVVGAFFLLVPTAGPTLVPQDELTTIVWPAVEPRFVAALVLTLGPKSVGAPQRTIEEVPEQAFENELTEPLPIAIRDFDQDGDFGFAVRNNISTAAVFLAANDAFGMPKVRRQLLANWWRYHRATSRRRRGQTWDWARLTSEQWRWRWRMQ
jgi:hypothetical protein